MLSFVPTFKKENLIKELEIAKGEKPEIEEIVDNDNKVLYIFLVDRSGSMTG